VLATLSHWNTKAAWVQITSPPAWWKSSPHGLCKLSFSGRVCTGMMHCSTCQAANFYITRSGPIVSILGVLSRFEPHNSTWSLIRPHFRGYTSFATWLRSPHGMDYIMTTQFVPHNAIFKLCATALRDNIISSHICAYTYWISCLKMVSAPLLPYTLFIKLHQHLFPRHQHRHYWVLEYLSHHPWSSLKWLTFGIIPGGKTQSLGK